MAIVTNRVYNDPALGAAFSNLANMFAPPSGGDLAGYATAKAKNEEAARLAQLFAAGGTPDELAARMGIQGYGNTATGFGADLANRAAMNAADNETQRYGYDTTAATSRANNAADNQRAIVTARYGTPLGANEVLPAMPADVAQMFSLPAAPAATGMTVLSPGELATMPDGTLRTGAPKPMTDAELRASVLAGLPADQQTAWALGVADSKPETANFRTADGRVGLARFDQMTGKWVNSQTGEVLPPDAVTFGASLQGSQGDTGLGPTAANRTEGNKLEASLNQMDADIKAMLDLLNANPGIAGLPGQIRGAAQNIVSSIKEISAAYSQQAPDAMMTLDEAKALAERLAPNRDPNIAKFQVMMAGLAYGVAQMDNPSGEVSRQAYDRALESLSGGFFANNDSAREALLALADRVARKRDNQLETLRNPGGSTTGAVVTVQSPEEARTLPSGTMFRTPDGRLMQVP